MTLLAQIRDASLTGAERRVADVILRDLESIAFGTVAELAKAAGTGGATVMRLAAKVGFEGFSELQAAARRELSPRLLTATERIRQQPNDDDLVQRAMTVEVANVQRSLAAVDRQVLSSATQLLVDARRVVVLAGDAGSGVASSFAVDLGMVRPDVEHAPLGDVALARALSWLGTGDVAVAIDVARYDRALVTAVRRVRDAGVTVIAISDSHLSPLAAVAAASFIVENEGTGPFDSYVGVLCLANLLVASLAALDAPRVTERLDRLEATWRETGALISGNDRE